MLGQEAGEPTGGLGVFRCVPFERDIPGDKDTVEGAEITSHADRFVRQSGSQFTIGVEVIGAPIVEMDIRQVEEGPCPSLIGSLH